MGAEHANPRVSIQDAYVDGRIDIEELERGLEREAAPSNEVTLMVISPRPEHAHGEITHGDTWIFFELVGSGEVVMAAIEALKCVVAKGT